METLLQEFIKTAPMTAILLYALWTVYNDGKKDRDRLIEHIDRLDEKIDDLKERVIRLELEVLGDKMPTSAKRPIPGVSP